MRHRPNKALGQHFLSDEQLIHQLILSIAPKEKETFLEIGPGEGAITFPLLEHPISLTAVELDSRLAQYLKKHATDNLSVVQSDILAIQVENLFDSRPIRVVGNLPYQITTPILFHLLAQRHQIVDMHLMMQYEVGARLIAKPGTKAYGRLSVMLQNYFSIEYVMDIPPEAFSPPPKVDSCVLYFKPHQTPPHGAVDAKLFSTLVKAAFANRRKTIYNNLKSLCSRAQLTASGIEAGLRAEDITVKQYVSLTQALSS